MIEALGAVGGCGYAPYTSSAVVNKAIGWIDQGLQVIIEISPEAGCGGIVTYELMVSYYDGTILNVVGSTRYNRYYGGIMVDEETDYGFSANTLINFDNNLFYTGRLAGRKLFSECADNGAWTQGQFNAIDAGTAVGNSTYKADWIPAPQIYNQVMANYQNTALNEGAATQTLVTTTETEPGLGYWNNYTNAVNAIGGAPWEFPTWGPSGWENRWQPR